MIKIFLLTLSHDPPNDLVVHQGELMNKKFLQKNIYFLFRTNSRVVSIFYLIALAAAAVSNEWNEEKKVNEFVVCRWSTTAVRGDALS